jgi:hypothetical protein
MENMEEKNQEEIPVKKGLIDKINQTRVGQFFFLFILMLVLFYCIEVLPLYFGPVHLPLDQIILRVKRKLPYVCTIAAVASLYLLSRRRPPKK